MTERKGSLIKYQVECGHWMVCYALEPTPVACPDCIDGSRKVMETLVGDITRDLDDVPGADDLKEWLDEWNVDVPDIRADIRAIVDLVDDGRCQLEQAEREGYKLLKKYPRAERLTLPETS